jgi:hypothetical protein
MFFCSLWLAFPETPNPRLSLTLAKELRYDARFNRLPKLIVSPEATYSSANTYPSREAIPMQLPSFMRQESLLLALFIALVTIGCSSKTEQPSLPPKADADQPQDDSTSAEEESPTDLGPVVLGNMVEPFDPPPLEELIASHEWQDRPVVDSMKRRREHQTTVPAPKLSAKEALAL